MRLRMDHVSRPAAGDGAEWLVNGKQTTSLGASYEGGMAPIIPIWCY